MNAPTQWERSRQSSRLRNWLHAELHDLPCQNAILAVGGEAAPSARHLTEYSSNITVLDASTGSFAHNLPCGPEIDFLWQDITKRWPLARAAFDAVWCAELPADPLDAAFVLQEMHRVLAPGGKLLLAVPCRARIRDTLIAWLNRDRPANLPPPLFTRKTLARSVCRAGFVDIRMRSREPFASVQIIMLKAKKEQDACPARASDEAGENLKFAFFPGMMAGLLPNAA